MLKLNGINLDCSGLLCVRLLSASGFIIAIKPGGVTSTHTHTHSNSRLIHFGCGMAAVCVCVYCNGDFPRIICPMDVCCGVKTKHHHPSMQCVNDIYACTVLYIHLVW